jgi:replication initiation and membrane attachment protein DnaB
VTVVVERYFGVPQQVIRRGTWAKLKPSEQSLYICLLHDSERYSSRELRRTDAQMTELTGVSSRALCDARKKLQEHGLIQYRRSSGNVYVYAICNPETKLPWPGDPKVRAFYVKKGERLNRQM